MANVGWTGGGDDSSWSDPGNWVNAETQTNGVPGASDDVGIAGFFYVVFDLSDAEINTLTLVNGARLEIDADGFLSVVNRSSGIIDATGASALLVR